MSKKQDRVKPARQPSIWANRDYTWWLAGDTTGMIGRSFSMWIVSFVAFALTGSEGSAGSLQTLLLAIMLIIAIPGGVIVDRKDRRQLIYMYSAITAVLTAVLCVVAFAGLLTFPLFVLLMCLVACVHGLFGEATNAALRSIMSGPGYVKAQAANQGRDAAVQLTAGPLVGLVYGFVAWLPYLLSSILFTIQGFVFTKVKTSLKPGGDEPVNGEVETGKPAQATTPVTPSMWKEFTEGVSYLVVRPTMRGLAMILILVNFGIAGMQTTMTLSLIGRGYAAVQVGYLGVALAAAILLASLVAGKLAARYSTGTIVILSLTWILLSVSPLLLSDHYGAMLGCSFALGLCIPVANAALLGYIFGQTPERLQGRVGTAMKFPTEGLAVFAPFIAGTLLENGGFHPAIILFFVVLVISVILGLCSRRVRHIPTPDDWENYD